MVSIDRRTSALATIVAAGHFALNFLAHGHSSTAEVFGGKGELKGAARFRPGDWGRLQTGAPIFLEAVGAMGACNNEPNVRGLHTSAATRDRFAYPAA